MAFDHIGVLGGGAWGTALAQVSARAGRSVTLWEHDAENATSLIDERESRFLPGVRLDNRVRPNRNLAEAAHADVVLLVVPAQAVRSVATMLSAFIEPGTPLIVCAKGIEGGTRKFMTEVITECAPSAVPAILSGPSFADDVARGLPTAVTLATADSQLAGTLARALGSATFRPYHSDDVRGVEIGGAAKNVLAIAVGIVAGCSLGASASAALTTRGFAELFRFGRAFGARTETLTGLSGLGDLILTCSGPQSRNFSLGLAIGSGQTPEQAWAGTKLTEGFYTAPVLLELAQQRNVEMPIAEAVNAILTERVKIGDAIEALLARPFKAEG